MTRKYTKEELISELHRFKRENGRVPTKLDMKSRFGYPSAQAYVSHFGSHNNALQTANLIPNQIHYHSKLDGTEVCSYCHKRADEIPNFGNWRYDEKGIRYCNKHGSSGTGGLPDYITGNLDINSNTGLGRAGEILVAKTLKIANEFDCNRISCGYKVDLYHDKYKKIDVKTSLLSDDKYNHWHFNSTASKEVKTYICLGLSSDRKNVEHVWIVPNEGKIRYQQGLKIIDSYRSLSNRSRWEVDSKPYDDMWQTMKLDNCKIMVDKNKEETEEEKQKHEKFKKEYFKKLGINPNLYG